MKKLLLITSMLCGAAFAGIDSDDATATVTFGDVRDYNIPLVTNAWKAVKTAVTNAATEKANVAYTDATNEAKRVANIAYVDATNHSDTALSDFRDNPLVYGPLKVRGEELSNTGYYRDAEVRTNGIWFWTYVPVEGVGGYWYQDNRLFEDLLEAADVPSWAMQSTKPTYSASEVGTYTSTQIDNKLSAQKVVVTQGPSSGNLVGKIKVGTSEVSLYSSGVTRQEITAVVNEVKALHYDPTLNVTWTNIVNNGHIYYVTVTNANVSVAQ